MRLIDEAAKETGKRTKKRLARIDISEKWCAEHDKAFSDLKVRIANLTPMAFPKDTHTMCLFTDASDGYLAAVLVQTKTENMDLQIPDRQYEPLSFLPGPLRIVR